MIKYRVYPDGGVVHEDDFAEADMHPDNYDDFQTYEVPDEVVEYIEEGATPLTAVEDRDGKKCQAD